MSKQKITPFLWFDQQAEEAANFYVSLFPGSRITRVTHIPGASEGAAGPPLTVEFELAGAPFVALNGGPLFKFNEAVSMSVDCESQHEVDDLWDKLTAGGSASQCGWLKDKYGLSWQIVPRILGDLLRDPDPAKAKRAMDALLKMQKIEIEPLVRAASGN